MRRVAELVKELRRRRVFRTAGIYIVSAWALLQVVALAFESFGIPGAAMRYVWFAAIAGFPLSLVFGWRYDITARGIVRTPPPDAGGEIDFALRRADYLVLAALAALAIVVVGGMIVEIRQGPLRAAGPWYAAERLATGIAVLPLENLSGDPGQEFLSAGLHDALITTLSRITRFRVTSRFSSSRIPQDMPLREVARTLDVAKVLSGSMTREADLVRVNVMLVDAETEQPLWADTFLRQFDGLISMQNEVASAVAREIKLRLSESEERQLANPARPDPDTYEAYLKGMFQLRKGSQRGYRRAIEILTAAVEEDPTSALAYAALAIGYSQLGHSPYPVAGAYLRAKEAAERALEFDPDLAEAHLAVGMYKIYYEWDFEAGEAAFRKALELNPSLVDAHYHYAWLLELWQRDEEALEYGEHAKKLNPLSPFYSAWLAEQYRDAGRYEAAIEEAESTLELNPDWPVAWIALGEAYRELGRMQKAIEAHSHLRKNRFWGFYFASTLASAGREQDAEEVRVFIDTGQNNAYTLALIYGGLKDAEETLRWLRVARDEKIPWYPWLIAWYPQTRFLYEDPRFRMLAAELGLELPAEISEAAPSLTDSRPH